MSYEEEGVFHGVAPTGEITHNVHQFLHDVAITKNTTKVGNLNEEELGKPKLPLRTNKELELFCRDIMDQMEFAEYFKKKGEILSSTSLSKDAKLINLAVIQRRETTESLNLTPKKKENKGWFKKKSSGGDLNQQQASLYGI